jgi:HPt (histidine-containing phosphotransfer) domain-containing protein
MDPFLALKREYLEGAAAKLPEMEAWLAAGQLSELQGAAHKLAGSGGFYGYDRISETGRLLEERARSGAGEIAEALGALSAAVMSALASIEG